MKCTKTYGAKIYVAETLGSSWERSRTTAIEVCRDYVDEVGLCVTVTPTTFVYTGDVVLGVIVGLINYPRFPSTKQEIRRHAFTLAKRLIKRLEQRGASIEFPDETVWISVPV